MGALARGGVMGVRPGAAWALEVARAARAGERVGGKMGQAQEKKWARPKREIKTELKLIFEFKQNLESF